LLNETRLHPNAVKTVVTVPVEAQCGISLDIMLRWKRISIEGVDACAVSVVRWSVDVADRESGMTSVCDDDVGGQSNLSRVVYWVNRTTGHNNILRFPSHRHSNIAVQWSPIGGTRKRGRPKKTWRRALQEDLYGTGSMWWDEAKTLASDRSFWRKAAAQCALMHGRN